MAPRQVKQNDIFSTELLRNPFRRGQRGDNKGLEHSGREYAGPGQGVHTDHIRRALLRAARAQEEGHALREEL